MKRPTKKGIPAGLVLLAMLGPVAAGCTFVRDGRETDGGAPTSDGGAAGDGGRLVCRDGGCEVVTCAPGGGLCVTPPRRAVCSEAEEAEARVHFEIPRTPGALGDDFYRLPFPNDLRRRADGTIDLTGHPRPGTRGLAVDPVGAYLDVIGSEASGFGLSQTVYFRFSRRLDSPSFFEPGALTFVDVTPGAPTFGEALGFEASLTDGRNGYVCPRFLALRPPAGAPLRPGAKYAVVLGAGVKARGGLPFSADSDLQALLAPAPPADATLAAAWQVYAPLRLYLAEAGRAAETVVGATLFTTGDPRAPVERLRAAVAAAPAPVVKAFVRCGTGLPSPCEKTTADDGHPRGCPGRAEGSHDEIHALVSLPIFQTGPAPYELPPAGGIELDRGSGLPRLERTEEVCVALTVPKGAPPAGGWPVIVYAHGTNGDFRSFIREGLAGEFASGGAAAGGGVAMVGFDGVLHGPRKGQTERRSEDLVFNVLNPAASRGTPLQAAADLFAMARALDELSRSGAALDGSRVGLYGHSQGGNAAALAAGYEPRFGFVVLTGTGGFLPATLLEKKSPVDIGSLIPDVLGETRVSLDHPVLSLMELYFGSADPLVHAARLVRSPGPGSSPRHVLHVFGKRDSFAPESTQRHFAQAAGLPVVDPIVEDPGLEVIASPVSGNVITAGIAVTAVQTQYAPAGFDGHHVATKDAAARRSIREAFTSHFADGRPTVSP